MHALQGGASLVRDLPSFEEALMLCDCSGEDWPILLVNEPWLLKTGAKQMHRQHCPSALPCLPPLPGLLSTSSHAWQQAGHTAALRQFETGLHHCGGTESPSLPQMTTLPGQVASGPALASWCATQLLIAPAGVHSQAAVNQSLWATFDLQGVSREEVVQMLHRSLQEHCGFSVPVTQPGYHKSWQLVFR